MSDIQEKLHKLEADVAELKLRNKRVERDKAWEMSWTRMICIAAMTYIFGAAILIVVRANEPLLLAAIPLVSYLLSMLSLSLVRKWWQRNS